MKVELADNVLTISGEKKAEKEEKNDDRYIVERSYGAFARSIELPDGVVDQAKGTKSGKPIGRPRIAAPLKGRIRAAHRARGASLRDLAAQFRVGRETVRRVRTMLAF